MCVWWCKSLAWRILLTWLIFFLFPLSLSQSVSHALHLPIARRLSMQTPLLNSHCFNFPKSRSNCFASGGKGGGCCCGWPFRKTNVCLSKRKCLYRFKNDFICDTESSSQSQFVSRESRVMSNLVTNAVNGCDLKFFAAGDDATREQNRI